MSYVRSGAFGGYGRGSGVGEEIQDFRGGEAVGLMDTHQAGGLAENIVPVVRLFGEDSDVFEGGQPEAQGDVEVAGGVGLGVRLAVIGDLPLVLHLLETVPGAAVLLAGFAE